MFHCNLCCYTETIILAHLPVRGAAFLDYSGAEAFFVLHQLMPLMEQPH